MRYCSARMTDYTDTFPCGDPAGSHGFCPKHFQQAIDNARYEVGKYAELYMREQTKMVALMNAEEADIRERSALAILASLGEGI